jgi:hypothetical protein
MVWIYYCLTWEHKVKLDIKDYHDMADILRYSNFEKQIWWLISEQDFEWDNYLEKFSWKDFYENKDLDDTKINWLNLVKIVIWDFNITSLNDKHIKRFLMIINRKNIIESLNNKEEKTVIKKTEVIEKKEISNKKLKIYIKWFLDFINLKIDDLANNWQKNLIKIEKLNRKHFDVEVVDKTIRIVLKKESEIKPFFVRILKYLSKKDFVSLAHIYNNKHEECNIDFWFQDTKI